MAFQMVCDEDVVRKNLFIFKLTDVVINDSVLRVVPTDERLAIWMDFIQNDRTYSKYYGEFAVLPETGMRVSGFCGLTKKDLDFTELPADVPDPWCSDDFDSHGGILNAAVERSLQN